MNGKIQPLPNPIPTNKPGVEPKRPPKPIDITALCKLSSTVPNYVDVSWAVDFGRGFTVSVYYVDRLASSDLLKELKDRGTRHADYTRALIKEKLNDKDSDVMTTSCKVTLACPLGELNWFKRVLNWINPVLFFKARCGCPTRAARVPATISNASTRISSS